MVSLSNMHDVIFQKPDIKRLTEQGYFCVDMHLHTSYSIDSKNSITKIIKKAKSLSIGISIADHNDIQGSIEASKHNIFLIPAIEITTSEGFHILFYFYTQSELKRFYEEIVFPNKKNNFKGNSRLGAKELIEEARNYNCIIVFAHPYRLISRTSFYPSMKKKLINRINKKVSFIEVINSKDFRWENKKATKLARDKGYMGGSDAHNLKEIGTTLTCAKNCKTVKGFLDAVKRKKVVVIGKEVNFSNKIPKITRYLKEFLGFKRRYH